MAQGQKSFLDRLCMDYAYAVAVREKGKGAPFAIKYPTLGEWWADPFVVNEDGRHYLFVERMGSYDRNGEIAVAEIVDGRIGAFRTALKETFHLSFPNVFRWQGKWYMLPETHQSEEMRLYRAARFPDRWALDTVLFRGAHLADHALYPTSDGFLVVSYDHTDPANQRNRLFALNMEKKTAQELKFPEENRNFSNIRPGGTFYQVNGKWHHVLQDCERAYGDFLHVYEVDCFTENEFREHELRTVRPGDLSYANDNGRLEHLHTYNCDDRYEVIDLQYKKFYPNKLLMHWARQAKKHFGKQA